MIRIDLNPESHWLDLPAGVRLRVAPLTTALMGAARADPRVEALPEDAPREAQAIALAKALAELAILDWEGVGDEEGAPLDPGPEEIDALLDVYPIFEAFQIGYVAKGLLVDAEKNASALSPNGTSAGATDTAPPVPADAPSAPPA
jgi:hypothetical protein